MGGGKKAYSYLLGTLFSEELLQRRDVILYQIAFCNGGRKKGLFVPFRNAIFRGIIATERCYTVPDSFPYSDVKNSYPYLLGTLFSEELLQRRDVVSLSF